MLLGLKPENYKYAVSGIIFAVVALGTGVITGRFFYKKKGCKV
jgi:hypothetical protein